LLKLRASNRGIIIHETFEPELPRLWADERAIRQICLNLLSNAIKFTPQAGEIWLKVGWTASGGQYISVKDTGAGIPERKSRSCLLLLAKDQIRLNRQNRAQASGCRSPNLATFMVVRSLSNPSCVSAPRLLSHFRRSGLAAMAPMPEHAPPIASAAEPDLTPEEKASAHPPGIPGRHLGLAALRQSRKLPSCP
jgi:two-component system cell cycle sensor histidine kinase PleC